MKVAFTPRARRRVVEVRAWWRANRPAAPELFEHELAEAVRALAEQPGLGRVYAAVAGRAMRRLLLRKTEQHLYYTVDEASQILEVHTVWGARRGRKPRL